MTDAEVLAALNDRGCYALTVWAEARGCSDAGRRGVASVIHNRKVSGRWGQTYRSVCLWPWQFSCWKAEGGVANHAALMALARALLDPTPTVLPASFEACRVIADHAINGTLEDQTHGATHYLTESLYASRPPSWARTMDVMARIGGHVFLR
jgi:N-acetylmuramoyl-L-alanine amidase